jgi:hypothetical protein
VIANGGGGPSRRRWVHLALLVAALAALPAVEMWLWRAAVYLAEPEGTEVDVHSLSLGDLPSLSRPGPGPAAASTNGATTTD